MRKRVSEYRCPECGSTEVALIEAKYWNHRVQEWANTSSWEDKFNCTYCGWSGETVDDLDAVHFEEGET